MAFSISRQSKEHQTGLLESTNALNNINIDESPLIHINNEGMKLFKPMHIMK